jgi:hypothetical protein
MMALDGCLTYGSLNSPTEKRRRGWRGGEPQVRLGGGGNETIKLDNSVAAKNK